MTATRTVPAAPPRIQRSRLLPRSYRDVVLWTAFAFAVSVPLLNTITLPGIGTVSRGTGIVFAGAGVVALVFERHRRRLNEAHVLLLLFMAWAGLSRLWSVNLRATENDLLTLVQLVITSLLVWEFARTREQVLLLLRGFWYGAAAVATTLVVGALTSADDPTRYTVAEAHPNSLAFVVTLAIVPAWYVSLRSPHRLERLAGRLYPVLAILAVMFTASRSALAVTAVALLVIPFTMGRIPAATRALAVVLVLGAVVAAVSIAPEKPLERLTSVTDEVENADFSGRGELWQASGVVLARNPVLGVGLGSTSDVLLREIGEDRGTHNTFLTVALELGVVGLLLFLLVVVACLVPTVRLRGPEGVMARVMAVTLVAGLLPRHWQLEKTTWLVLALLLGLALATTSDREGYPA